jgi:hypothetical protein
MRQILEGHGLNDAEIDAEFTMFNFYQVEQMGDDSPLSKNGSKKKDGDSKTHAISTFAAPKES